LAALREKLLCVAGGEKYLAKAQRRQERQNTSRFFATWRLGERIFLESIDNASDPVFDQRHMEVDEQAEAFVGEPEIGEKLLLVYRSEQLDRFDFHDYFVFDNQISPKSSVKVDILIDHRNRLLTHSAETAPIQFIDRYGFVYGLEQAWAKLRVDAESSVHNLPGDDVLSHDQASASAMWGW
jgi:hypothetical protein